MIQLVPLFRGPQPSGWGPILVPWPVGNWTAEQEMNGSEGSGGEWEKFRLLLLITGITAWSTPPTSPWKNFLLVPGAQKVGDCCPCWSIPRELLLRLYWSDEEPGDLTKMQGLMDPEWGLWFCKSGWPPSDTDAWATLWVAKPKGTAFWTFYWLC